MSGVVAPSILCTVAMALCILGCWHGAITSGLLDLMGEDQSDGG